MKKTGFILLGALFIIALISIVPVSAQNSFSQSVSIQSPNGGVPASFTMTIAAGSVSMPVNIGTNTAAGPEVTIQSNSPYTVSVTDPMNYGSIGSVIGKTPGSAGHMAGVSTTSGQWDGSVLANPLGVTLGSTSLSLSGSPQTLMSGNSANFDGNLGFSQVVVTTDPALPSTDAYLVEMLVTGGAN